MAEPEFQPDSFKQVERAEWNRRDALSRAMCATVTLIVTIFAIKDAAIGNAQIAGVLAGFAFANLMALIAYTRFIKSLELFGYYLILSSTGLGLYLVASGGTDDSGLLWLPCYPVLMFSVLRVRIAAYANIGMLISVGLILYAPENTYYIATYTIAEKVAGIGAFILIAVFSFYQAYVREVSAVSISRLNKELSHIASTDELTQLPNRRDMALRLEFECKRSKRTKEDFAIIMCDIDYFKKVNDSFGHSVGDQTLQEFSKLLVSRFRETDKIGRWGGEEFLAVLPHTSLPEAIKLANEVRTSICQASLFPNMPNRMITMSAGVASSTQSLDPGELLGIADSNLYNAKEAGRNRVKPDPVN